MSCVLVIPFENLFPRLFAASQGRSLFGDGNAMLLLPKYPEEALFVMFDDFRGIQLVIGKEFLR